MVRTILCIITGIVFGILCVLLLEMLSVKLFPPPSDVNPSDEAQLRNALAAGRISAGALICVLFGQVPGFGGRLTSRRTAKLADLDK